MGVERSPGGGLACGASPPPAAKHWGCTVHKAPSREHLCCVPGDGPHVEWQRGTDIRMNGVEMNHTSLGVGEEYAFLKNNEQ